MTFTREELYRLVWSEPLRTLAKRFGISDVALAKRCRAANIPLPGLGYWAKKEAGKKVFQPALPQRGLGQSDSLDIGPEQRRSYGEGTRNCSARRWCLRNLSRTGSPRSWPELARLSERSEPRRRSRTPIP